MNYSVVIPYYDSYNTIDRTINSILDQTIQPDEIIIVNDGSKYNKSIIVLNEILTKSFLVKVLNKKNEGAAIARNYGVLNCSSDLVAFLDSDDAWEKNKMEKQIEYLKQHPQFKAVASVYKPLSSWVKNVDEDNIMILDLNKQIIRNHIQTSTFVVYRDIFIKVGGFPKDQTHAEEGDLYFKIFQYSQIPIFLYPYVVYGNGYDVFNVYGLSGNIIEMYKGEIKNIWRLYQRKQINFFRLITVYVYSFSKFCFRIIKRKL